MDEPERDEWQELVEQRGKRARRRETEATREAGHLQHFFYATDQRWIHTDSSVSSELWKQLMRANKHSCHCAGCVERRKRNRRMARRERYAARRSLKWMR